MRAIVVRQHGRPEVLQIAEMPDPRPGPGQLLVDVAAAGVNFMDIYQRQGNPPYASDLPYVPGAEGAGTIAGVGPDVQGFADGDRVAWTGVPGSYAERVVLPAGSAVPVPDGIDLQLAAAVMLQGLTAHYLSNSTYPVAGGDHVVVHAAARSRHATTVGNARFGLMPQSYPFGWGRASRWFGCPAGSR